MLYFSSLLKTNLQYSKSAKNLFAALSKFGEEYDFFDGAKDIWARDYMPVKVRSGKYISFRYEPGYLKDYPQLQTDFKKDIAPKLGLPVIYSHINLDGGNVVFSPSGEKAIITDRVFSENPKYEKSVLISELEKLLEAEIIIITSLKSDMTGHADGMVRFVDEHTAIGNCVPSKNGLEQRIKRVIRMHGIDVIDFPYQTGSGISAVGSYLNFLETESCIFLPTFGIDMDATAIATARRIFTKRVVPVNIQEVAEDGGCLNCISWG